MSAWLAWVKQLLAQLAAERAEMFAASEEDRSGENAPPIPFWLWHMF